MSPTLRFGRSFGAASPADPSSSVSPIYSSYYFEVCAAVDSVAVTGLRVLLFGLARNGSEKGFGGGGRRGEG